MDSIVKLLLALIIGYCFVKLFCGCSVEGMDNREKQLLSEIEEIEEEGKELLKEIQEKYNPTPTPASNNAQQLGSFFGGCERGQSIGSWEACTDCPVHTYNDEGGYSATCKQCPLGSVPITDNGSMGQEKSTDCRFCGLAGGWFHEGRTDTGMAQGYYGERYSDGLKCQDCPANSHIDPNVKNIHYTRNYPRTDQDHLDPSTEVYLLGGRNINDCICNGKYTKKDDGKGGFTCV